MKTLNEFLAASSGWAWPLVVLLITLIYKNELSRLLNGIRKANLFGNDLEFEKDIQKFGVMVTKAENAVPEATNNYQDDFERELVSNANANPRIAILTLASEIEKTMREILVSTGWNEGKRYVSARESFCLLERNGQIPKQLLGAVEIFYNLRNKIAHGFDNDNDNHIIHVVDIGMSLLKTLRSIPHEIHTVHRVNIAIYSDSECTLKREDVIGVILESKSSTGIKPPNIHIFPTKKVGYYKVGKNVAWEWNLSNVWGQSWYIDSDTNIKKLAWSSSGEFVGRFVDAF